MQMRDSSLELAEAPEVTWPAESRGALHVCDPVRAHNAPALADGLCNGCTHRDSCTLPMATRGAVLFCEEFSSSPAHPSDRFATMSLPQIDGASSVVSGGLCATCRWRDDCSYPKPDGGVWHCEEFE